MGKCEFCGKEELLPFRCPYCGKYFCIEHRLPENHNCPEAPARTPLGSASHPNKNPYMLTLPKNKRKEKEKSTEFIGIIEPIKDKPKKRINIGSIIVAGFLICILGLLMVYAPALTQYLNSLNKSNKTYTENFILTEWYTTRSIELEKGNKVIGNITVANLPPSFQLSVWVEDPDRNRILEVLMKAGKTSSERYGFFNFTASYSGVYRIKFYYYSYSTEKSYPTVTLQYSIENSNPFNINLPPNILRYIIGFLMIPLVIYIIFKLMKP